jgi:hypothetical protein
MDVIVISSHQAISPRLGGVLAAAVSIMIPAMEVSPVL